MQNYIKRIKNGETVEQIKNETRASLGAGMYSFIGVIITKKGLSEGWKYEYPCMKFNGVMFLNAGKTLEQGIIDGHLEFKEKVLTAF